MLLILQIIHMLYEIKSWAVTDGDDWRDSDITFGSAAQLQELHT